MKYLVRSIANRGKLKNGDSFKFYEDDNIMMASVADGVGGNACDWKASAQICNDLESFYRTEFKVMGVKSGIGFSLKKAFKKIYAEQGVCEGMLTTLVSIIVDKQANKFYYIGIGDSLILKFEKGKIESLTPETAFKIPIEDLSKQVQEGGDWRDTLSFALMSDGFSENRKGFKTELSLIVDSENWESKFDQIMQLNRMTQFDDMTLMLLKA